MLVLSRKVGERILIGGDVEIVVVEVRGGYVRLGIEAPRTVPVHRKELRERMDAVSAASLEDWERNGLSGRIPATDSAD